MSSSLSWPSKDPNERLDYQIDWTAALEPGDSIQISEWTVEAGLTPDGDYVLGGITAIWLTGGVENVTYRVGNRITTVQGRIYDQTVKIRVRTR